MISNQRDSETIPFPRMRHVAIDLMREASRQHSSHALLEVDVTKPRQYLRAHKASTGEALSFTAFVVTCLARAIDENKTMQAYRLGRKQLILFDDVDVITMIEREADGQKIPAARFTARLKELMESGYGLG